MLILYATVSFLGYGLTVHHLRQNEQCGLLEELPPIDSNLKYDFNYQVCYTCIWLYPSQ